jgi:uncharacterized protein YyaL (SSP411 family)
MYASNLNWYSDAKKAFEIAKKENKLVLVDISKDDCPPCEFMKDVVMDEKGEVNKLLKKEFVLLEYTVGKDKIPEKFRKHFFNFTPAILIYNKNSKLIKTVYGATSYKMFLSDLKSALKEK